MCGICGAFRPGGRPVAPEAIAAMSAAIRHRGPDDTGAYHKGSAALGFRRLSIVDVAGGHQPIANEGETLHLVCNGEIYNHRALRDGLRGRGHRFRTGSDAEVILPLYEEVGEALVDRLDGQFAFALLDTARNRLLLARDPFGVAPLFYTWVNGAFVFASEIKALLAYPGVERRVDLVGLDQLLSLPGLVSPRTMFAGINSVPPGHLLTVDGRGSHGRAYWDMAYPPQGDSVETRSEADWCEELDVTLQAAVTKRLQGEVPIGAYLSGGLDSSLVTAMMQGAEPVRTFSIHFGDSLFDEQPYQRLVAERFGCTHKEVPLPLTAIEQGLRAAVWHAECPLRETYNTASLALSAAARRDGVPVVLSGEGADELFAGYVGYRYDAFRRARGTPPLAPREAELRRRLWGDETIFYEQDLAAHEARRKALYAPALRADFDAIDFTRHDLVDTRRLAGIDPQHQRAYLDLKLRVGDHLVGDHGDRMLLANAVEGRFPFLDLAVADCARRMPPGLKLNGAIEKYILKQVGRAWLPNAITEREKYAFNAPGSAYLLACGIDWVEQLLDPATIRRQGYFDAERVAALARTARASDAAPGQGNEADPLMTILTFGLFLDLFDMPELGT
ncbi:asparagine synthase (glutamine-hydrolyzing) [Sphingomonas sp. MMS12-HWE2-04]|uniref:asparagine synthase (glutamine-hydrolyzing) n=1 Tax=Sphingomonas sp. MMS12-HWE2-04 TaxID=3234199 RepID=UPI00384E2379